MKFTEHNERVLEKFATMIIERMEQMKDGKWQQGWVGKAIGGSPVNIEGRNYGGANIMMLLMDCSLNDYKYPIYCTLKQANKLGGHIKKGSQSMPVIFWDYMITTEHGKKIKYEEYRLLSQAERDRCTVVPFLKSYNVFNVEQTDLDEKCPDKIKQLQGLFKLNEDRDSSGMYESPELDELLDKQNWICPIRYDKPADSAFYSTSQDIIVVPMKSQFKLGKTKKQKFINGQEYYATLLHEMVHSTGTEERLNRNTGKRYGDKLYAREELVAELGAARVGQILGFDKHILDNNAAYLDGWIANLKKEPTFVLTLMTDVDKASRMILDKMVA